MVCIIDGVKKKIVKHHSTIDFSRLTALYISKTHTHSKIKRVQSMKLRNRNFKVFLQINNS